jgi:putative pyruvate formate lyase activating enzyme
VASAFAHHGEEDPLRGWKGSGTIFLAGCNLRCVFCQNFDVSWQVGGVEVSAEQLARLMLELQARGCHNINWVTPEHVVPQLLEALAIAVEEGLRLPIVYNTSSYDSPESLALLDGVVDIYMPDFKLWTLERARRYLRRPDYPEVARRSILEMHRQVGPLELDGRGLAVRGVLLRHLVMPGLLDETETILRWVADRLGPDTYLNLMGQYRPDGLVPGGDYPEIARRPGRDEILGAVEIAHELGLRRLDAGGLAAAAFPARR